jgi:thiol-disulfide isomerase/thioredoxin
MTFFRKFLFALILMPFLVFSQKTIITGTARGAQGKTIRFVKYADQITYTDSCITSAPIDSSGKFKLTLDLKTTIFSYLKIDLFRAPFYIEPGKMYNLQIDSVDYNAPDDKVNHYLQPSELAYKIMGVDSLELNNVISKFNKEYDTFLAEHFIYLLKTRDRKKIDAFRLKTESEYNNVKNDYFNNIIRYRFALLEFSTKLSGIPALLKTYFLNQPILYENTAYMEFFNQFFEGYITGSSKYITFKDLDVTVNSLAKCSALMDTLGKDSLLQNEKIREMVMLKGLGDLFQNKLFNRNAILFMLNDFSKQTKFAEHKAVAMDYLRLYTRLVKDAVAPAFTLKNFNNETFTLSEFKDRYVYLVFWTTWCIPCISEMQLLTKMKQKYGSKVEFVSIACDKQYLTAYYYLQSKKPEITSLFWGNQYSLLENYDVRAFPTYMLIGPDGKIMDYPTISPGVDLDSYLSFITGIKGK